MGQYLPIVIMLILGLTFAGVSLVMSKLVSPKRPSAAKAAPYECGIVPGQAPPERFPVRFYLVAMIFIVVDIEIIFLYPYVVIYDELGFFGLAEMLVFAIAVFAILQIILNRTPLGLQMRAVTQNRRMASAMGIRTPFVDAMTFALGSGIAGLAGVALSQIDNVSPNLGQGYIIDSFMVVVFGGVGNLWGTLVGALTLGVANKFLEPYAGAVLAKIVILVLIIVFIQRRPRGLFALKGRAIES